MLLRLIDCEYCFREKSNFFRRCASDFPTQDIFDSRIVIVFFLSMNSYFTKIDESVL